MRLKIIIGAGKGTVREHITVKVIAYGVAVERDQTVVGVILEATARRRGYISRQVIAKAFFRQHSIIQILDGPLGNSAKVIISITHLGRICKYFSCIKTAAPEGAAENTFKIY